MLVLNPTPHIINQFDYTLRVYYEDTDAGGIVYYANYLKFFERARTEWMRALGIEHSQLLHEYGMLFIVVNTQIQYRQSARLDQQILVRSKITRVGAASITFEQAAYRITKTSSTENNLELLAQGNIKVGAVRSSDPLKLSHRPCALPASLFSKLTALVQNI